MTFRDLLARTLFEITRSLINAALSKARICNVSHFYTLLNKTERILTPVKIRQENARIRHYIIDIWYYL